MTSNPQALELLVVLWICFVDVYILLDVNDVSLQRAFVIALCFSVANFLSFSLALSLGLYRSYLCTCLMPNAMWLTSTTSIILHHYQTHQMSDVQKFNPWATLAHEGPKRELFYAKSLTQTNCRCKVVLSLITPRGGRKKEEEEEEGDELKFVNPSSNNPESCDKTRQS